jgi:hypothetical protein
MFNQSSTPPHTRTHPPKHFTVFKSVRQEKIRRRQKFRNIPQEEGFNHFGHGCVEIEDVSYLNGKTKPFFRVVGIR